MPKFIKSVIEKSRAAKSALKLKAAFKSQQGLYTFYSIWFNVIDGWSSGKPSKIQQMGWNTYVIPFIPRDWMCDDVGFENVSAKKRCKLIKSSFVKLGKISVKDRNWLKKELRKGFEDDFKDKGLEFSNLLVDMPEDKILRNVRKVKSDKKFKEMLK